MKRIILTAFIMAFMLLGKAQTNVLKTPEADTAIYTSPEFIGQNLQMYRFFSRTMRYPPVAYHNNIQGQVVVRVIIEKDGSLSDFKIIQGVSAELDTEALRVVKLMPVWIPGNINGNAVRSYVKIPFGFTISR